MQLVYFLWHELLNGTVAYTRVEKYNDITSGVISRDTKTISVVSKLRRFTILFALERANVFRVLTLFVEPLSD